MPRGLREHLEADGRIDENGHVAVCNDFVHNINDNDIEFYDDVSGRKLNPQIVEAARREELALFQKHTVYEKVPLQRCIDETGKQPIGIKWIDTNKGDETCPDYRSRLVAQEIKRSNLDEMFAATPPLEAKKYLDVAGNVVEAQERPTFDALIHRREEGRFHAEARRPVFVKLPVEDGSPGMCGRLLKSFYGTRDAASNWEERIHPGPSREWMDPRAIHALCLYPSMRCSSCGPR